MTAETNKQPNKPKIKEPQRPPPVSEPSPAHYGFNPSSLAAAGFGSPIQPPQRRSRLDPATAVFTNAVMRQVVEGGSLAMPEGRSARPLRQTAVLQIQQQYGNASLRRMLDQRRVTPETINHNGDGSALIQRDDDDPATALNEVYSREVEKYIGLRDRQEAPYAYAYYARLVFLLANIRPDTFQSQEEINKSIELATEIAWSEDDTLEKLGHGTFVEQDPEAFPNYVADYLHFSLWMPFDDAAAEANVALAFEALGEFMKRVPDGILAKGLPVNINEALNLNKFEISRAHGYLGEDHIVRDAAREIEKYAATKSVQKNVTFWNQWVAGTEQAIRDGTLAVDFEALARTTAIRDTLYEGRSLSEIESFEAYEPLGAQFTALHQSAGGVILAGGLLSIFDFFAGWEEGQALFDKTLREETDPRIAGMSGIEKMGLAIDWAIERDYFTDALIAVFKAIVDNIGEALVKMGVIIALQAVPFVNLIVDAYLIGEYGREVFEALANVVSAIKGAIDTGRVEDVQKAAAKIAYAAIGAADLLIDLFLKKRDKGKDKSPDDPDKTPGDVPSGKPTTSGSPKKPFDDPLGLDTIPGPIGVGPGPFGTPPKLPDSRQRKGKESRPDERTDQGDVKKPKASKPMDEGHNTAKFAKLKEKLKAEESANEAVDSLRTGGKLPPEYMTKAEAMAAGWEPGKALHNTSPGRKLGGDRFNDDDGLLPDTPGRTWFEADIGMDYTRSRKKNPGTRLLYSSDGLLYITTDHYNSFHPIGKWKD